MMRSAALALCAALCCACTATIDMKYEPKNEAEPIHVTRMPKLYFMSVEDRSTGFAYNGMGATQSGKLTRPITDVMQEAIGLELRRAGVPLVAKRQDADAVLKAAVLGASESVAQGVNGLITASISLSLQLRSLTGELIWGSEVSGQGSRPAVAPGVPGIVPTLSINDALANTMSKLHRALEEEGALERVFRVPVYAAPAAPAPVAAPVAERAPAAPTSDVDVLPAPGAKNPHSYAVVIGVEHYREKLPNADFASGDAKLTAEYLKRVMGVPGENIALLTEDHAAKGDFEKYLERWLPNRVKAGDEVFIYYSGHGAPNPAKGDAYMVPYDGDPTYIEQTGYSVKRLYDELAKLPTKQVYVAMDSCFSGAGGRSVLAKGARPLVSVVQNDLPANVTVMAASAGDQISNSYQDKGHGLFTYFFLKGLKEKGADLKAVYGYLKPQVARVAREQYNADQDPQWRQGK